MSNQIQSLDYNPITKVIEALVRGGGQRPISVPRTDGSTPAQGQIGELSAVVSDTQLFSLGTTKDAYVDIGLSWTQEPGNWIFLAQAILQIDVITTGGAQDGMIGHVAIRTSANVVVAETAVCTGNVNLQRPFGSAPAFGFQNISVKTTYKLSYYLRTINSAVSISGALIRGDYRATTVLAYRYS